jgi:hypothetical protein
MSDTKPNERALLKSALSPAGDCPGLTALAGADLSPEIQRHVSGCSRCRTELAMLREFENGAPNPEEAAAVHWIQDELLRRAPQFARPIAAPPRPSPIREGIGHWVSDLFSPRRRFALSMVGVSLLLLITAGIYSRRGSEEPLANPAHPAVWRSGQFAAVSPIGDITRPPANFQWESVQGAVKYVFQLSGVDGAELWHGESSETNIEPSKEIRNLLKPGRAFHWKVDAQNAAGETIASTGSQTFHIVATTR